MKKTGRVRSLVIILALLLPMATFSIQSLATQSSVWIVYADASDENILLAGESFAVDMSLEGYIVQDTTFDNLKNIPLYSDAIVLIGHGHKEGLEQSNSILPWHEVNSALIERGSEITILLACNSPSNTELGIYGFSGTIDAQAGALVAAWHVKRSMSPGMSNVLSSEVLDFQQAMNHPLESYVYFVHGYHGSNDQFTDLINQLFIWGTFAGYDDYFFHSYLDDYSSVGNAHSASIEEFAVNFRDHLLNTHPAGTQIDIVSHSLGGIIARQMIMADRDTMEGYGVEIGRVITLGTPNQGTPIADVGIGAYFTHLFDVFFNDVNWMSEVYLQVGTASPFMATLNADPMSYSAGIEWYTVSATDIGIANLLWPLHGCANDGPVGIDRAHLTFATNVYLGELLNPISHVGLVDDETQQRSYGYIDTWLAGSIDSDSDGIIDAQERYVYNTDPDDWDSDNDGLSDYDELFVYSTLPLDWDSDNDAINDYYELFVYSTLPMDSDSDNDGLSDYDELFVYSTLPMDSDSDNDGLNDYDELFVYSTLPLDWDTDNDGINDGSEVSWGYDPTSATDPINAPSLVYSAWQVSGATGYVRANHYTAMDYVKVYVKYKNVNGYWSGYFYVGTDSTPYYSGDYYVSWSILQGYVQMCVKVVAYDSANHCLGVDYQYVTLPSSGGGGKPGGDPVPI